MPEGKAPLVELRILREGEPLDHAPLAVQHPSSSLREHGQPRRHGRLPEPDLEDEGGRRGAHDDHVVVVELGAAPLAGAAQEAGELDRGLDSGMWLGHCEEC